jgi:hypothetical protein
MDRCPSCQSPLEWSAQRERARCTGCAGLYAGDGTPIRLEAPGGGFNPEFQAIFEQELGFPARIVPNRPPAYWGGGGGGTRQPMPPNPIQRIIQLSIAGFVFFILAAVGAYVAWVLFASIPH